MSVRRDTAVRVRVSIPTPLRDEAGGAAVLDVDAETVRDALEALAAEHPSLSRHLFDEHGALREHVNTFVNEHEARALEGLDTRLKEGDEVAIVPSIAGGSAVAGGTSGTPAAGGAPGQDGEAASAATDRPADGAAALTPEELARYSRHLALPELGREGQLRLRRARVLLIGAGGLGSPAALYLAAAGIGTLGVVDFDRVDHTNLHRQVLYGDGDVGRPKIEAALERLRGVNPNVALIAHETRLTSANALDLIRDYDLVVDGSDNFPTRYLVNDACVLLGKPYVYGAILRFEGQLSVFAHPDGPCYRCLFRQPPPPGLVPSCAEGGVLGVLPGIIGSLQALEAIKLIAGIGETAVGRLVIFDALALRWREMRLRRNPDCPACGAAPTIRELIDYEEFCGVTTTGEAKQDEGGVPEISPTELKTMLDEGQDVTLLDVREPFEHQIANLDRHGVLAIPTNDVQRRMDEIERERDIVVFCRSGARSEKVARMLRDAGYPRVRNLAGGLLAWSDEVDPTVRKY